jgi:hypothetical protein
MWMQRYNARHIAQWSTSRASLEALLGKFLDRIAPAAAMVNSFGGKHKTLSLKLLLANNYHTIFASKPSNF